MFHFLPLVVPELPRFYLLFGDLNPNFASKFEARSKPPTFHIMKDANSKMVKKLSSHESYGKTAGIFQYFVTFTTTKMCVYN